MQQNKRILGLDISKSSVSACLLESKPNDPRQFYYECPFMLFSANSEGIKAQKSAKAGYCNYGTNRRKLLAYEGVHI